MRRIFIGLTLLLASLASHATPPIMEAFHEAANLSEDSKLRAGRCMLCHTNPPKRNTFGRELHQAWEEDERIAAMKTAYQSIANLDADGDGFSNEVEIKSDSFPGDPDSVPAKPAARDPEDAPPPGKSSPIPYHGMHPAIVHFPVALGLIGALLFALGTFKDRELWRKAGMLNWRIGAIASVLAVISGLYFQRNSGDQLTGTLYTHFLSGLTACGLMLVLSLPLVESKLKPKALAMLMLGVAGVIGFTGHLGGTLVFGL